MDSRTCVQCNETKSQTEFYAKSGNNCKCCVKARVAEVKAAKKLGVRPSTSPSEMRRNSDTKICSCCGELKDKGLFYGKSGTNGLSGECKECILAKGKQRRVENHVPTENEVLSTQGYRKCSSCGEVHNTELFHKKRKSLEGVCKPCKAAKHKERLDNDPTLRLKIAARTKEYLEQNPDVVKRNGDYHKRYYKANKKAHRESCNKWFQRNKQRMMSSGLLARYSAQYRARKKLATPIWATTEIEHLFEIEIYHLAKLRKAATGICWEVDHIVPLTSDVVCGLHCSANLQLLTTSENTSKGNRWWPDMWTNGE